MLHSTLSSKPSFARVSVACMGFAFLLCFAPIAVCQNGVVAWGDNGYGQTTVPGLPVGLSYTQVAAGGFHTMALRSDGSAVAWGNNNNGQTTLSALPVGLSYTQMAAGYQHTVALRSNGSVLAWGYNSYGQTTVPAGLSCTQVAAGGYHSVALLSGGSAVAWGYNGSGQITVPALPAGLSYTQLAAGWTHTVALRSDGSALAWGDNLYGQTTVPVLPAGLSYTQVSAGQYHSVALRSDGTVVAWGQNNLGQIVVPGLPAGQSYTQVSEGQQHTVALLALPNAFMVATVGASPVGVPITYALSTQNPPAPFTSLMCPLLAALRELHCPAQALFRLIRHSCSSNTEQHFRFSSPASSAPSTPAAWPRLHSTRPMLPCSSGSLSQRQALRLIHWPPSASAASAMA